MLPSILITDDDRDFRETLRGVFEPQGFRTLLAGDGDEALDIVRREDVHLLLLDMHMPRLTGLETLRLVKQFKSRLPCILLSANADALLVEQAMRADAFSFLSKPVSRQKITATVWLALQGTFQQGAYQLAREFEAKRQGSSEVGSSEVGPSEVDRGPNSGESGDKTF